MPTGISFSAGLRLALIVGLLLTGTGAALAAPTPEQRKEVDAIKDEVSKAAKLYGDQKFKEAGDIVKSAQERIAKYSEKADAAAI
ncbi:MAG TPA: hypothetical protein VL096_12690, partial [Pirellulaceae bacterium]|nr:hypothetical protein [Pirellulaceae bacterium]